MMTKQMTLNELFTDKQLATLKKVYDTCKANNELPNKKLILAIEPMMKDVNKKTGQDNLPSYIAYMVEYVFSQFGR